jgi:hypothetical protein
VLNLSRIIENAAILPLEVRVPRNSDRAWVTPVRILLRLVMKARATNELIFMALNGLSYGKRYINFFEYSYARK